MLVYGLPAALQMSIISISDMTLQAVVNTYGTTLVVAYGVCIKVEGLGMQVGDALGTALGTLPDKIRERRTSSDQSWISHYVFVECHWICGCITADLPAGTSDHADVY